MYSSPGDADRHRPAVARRGRRRACWRSAGRSATAPCASACAQRSTRSWSRSARTGSRARCPRAAAARRASSRGSASPPHRTLQVAGRPRQPGEQQHAPGGGRRLHRGRRAGARAARAGARRPRWPPRGPAIDARAGDQRQEQLEHRRCRTRAWSPRAATGPVRSPARAPSRPGSSTTARCGDLDALGPAGRARGVDHVGRRARSSTRVARRSARGRGDRSAAPRRGRRARASRAAAGRPARCAA